MNIRNIIKKSIDLHVHVGPEIIPRKFNVQELIKKEKGKLKGIVIKSHFFNTASMPKIKNSNLKIFDSVVLNNSLGGLNPAVIDICARLSNNRIIVWFPTIDAKNFIIKKENKIPKEWGIDTKIKINTKYKGISILTPQGNLKKEVFKILKNIKKTDSVLATGHLSWQESQKLVNEAVNKFNIKRIIITHPIYQPINMPLKIQKELVEKGAFIEQCYSMYLIDKIPIKKIVDQIKIIGPEKCIISSDVGQIFSPNPSTALLKFSDLLLKESISLLELKKMLCDNPKKIIL